MRGDQAVAYGDGDLVNALAGCFNHNIVGVLHCIAIIPQPAIKRIPAQTREQRIVARHAKQPFRLAGAEQSIGGSAADNIARSADIQIGFDRNAGVGPDLVQVVQVCPSQLRGLNWLRCCADKGHGFAAVADCHAGGGGS